MSNSAQNVLIIMADEHAKQVIGAYGNSVIETPHLDRLAAEGVRFDAAYCNSPLCVPSRASFATGQYVHQTGHWDNATAYEGKEPSWASRLVGRGHEVVSIGKLHYRNASDPTGFSKQIIPLHIHDGKGDQTTLLRDWKRDSAKMAKEAGAGDSSYLQYDREILKSAVTWLEEKSNSPIEKPWVLFVSFVCPHFPLIAPPEYFDRYISKALPFPNHRHREKENEAVKALRNNMDYDSHFVDDAHVLKGLAAYYGMVSFLDDNIGQLLKALNQSGFRENTLTIYTADHGDNLGVRNLWGKSTMYEESAAVPLIVQGSGYEGGLTVDVPVSLVDLYPTIIEAAGELMEDEDHSLPGRSLKKIMSDQQQCERTVFSEYHAAGAVTGTFMVRWSHYKFIHHDGYPSELFDLQADPTEGTDVARDPAYAEILKEGQLRLNAICDPAIVNARAFSDQRRKIDQLGGISAVSSMKSLGYSPAPISDPVGR